METLEAMQIGRDALWVLLKVSAPVMFVSLAVGLVIALFQALTQIQEMTLTFVPKLAAMLAVFWMSMGFMAQSVVSFFQDKIIPLIVGV